MNISEWYLKTNRFGRLVFWLFVRTIVIPVAAVYAAYRAFIWSIPAFCEEWKYIMGWPWKKDGKDLSFKTMWEGPNKNEENNEEDVE